MSIWLHQETFKSNLVIVAEPGDLSHLEMTSSDWKRFYPDINGEVLSPNMPQPKGKSVQIKMFCDAAHATDLVTRRSTTGFIFFINGTPINWFSKEQNIIESSTFGSEIVALPIAVEMNQSLRYKLRMFGAEEIDGPTYGFCDNNSVVLNVTHPESTLAKKHNSVVYHKTRECATMKTIRIHYEKGKENCSDV
jgi:hypothetical protein